MKKIFYMFLSFVLLLTSVCMPAYAEPLDAIEISKEYAYYDESLGAHVVPFTLNADNTLNYLTKAQVDELKHFTEIDMNADVSEIDRLGENDIIRPLDYREWYEFDKISGPVKYVGAPKKVSADFTGPKAGGSVTKTISFQISHTFSANVGTSIEKSLIQAGAGFSWTESAGTSTSYTANLDEGEVGYVSFSPYYDRVYGKMNLYSNWDGLISSKYVYGYSVMLTDDGEPDGMYEFIYYD